MKPDSIQIRYSRPKLSQFPEKDAFEAVSKGKLSMLHKLVGSLDSEGVLSAKDSSGKTLIHYSSYLGLQNLTFYLLDHGVDPFQTDSKNQTAFHALAFKGHYSTARLILNFEMNKLRQQLNESVNHMKASLGMSTMNLQSTGNLNLTASIEADLRIQAEKQKFDLKLLESLDNFFKSTCELFNQVLNTSDEYQRNPLHYASLSKFTWNAKTAHSLLSVEFVEDLGEFLEIHYKVQELEWNPQKKSNPKQFVNILDTFQRILPSQLFEGSLNNFRKNYRQVLTECLNSVDQDGNSPLHIASWSGDVQAVKLFIQNGADKKAKNLKGETPLEMASTKIVMKYLSSLEEMTNQGDEEGYTHLVNSGYDSNLCQNEFMLSSLHTAVIEGKMLETVLQSQANPNLIEWNQYTPLHYGAIVGNLEECKILLKQGANPNALSQYKYTPLHLAAHYNQPLVLELLYQQPSIKVNPKDNKLRTPLMLAAKTGALNSVKKLLQLGCDIYACDKRHWTALHFAGFNSNS